MNILFIYTYLLAKFEEVREYSSEFVKIKFRISKLTNSESKELIDLIEEIKKKDTAPSDISKAMLTDSLDLVQQRAEKSKPKSFVSVKKNDSLKIPLGVAWLDYNKNELAAVASKDVVNILKNKIENAFKENGDYDISDAAQLKITGKIVDFKIVDERVNDQNVALERRIELLLDIELSEIKTATKLFTKKGLYNELKYYTVDFSKEMGKSEKESLDELFNASSEKVMNEINKKVEGIKDKLRSGGKKEIQLSDVQKGLIENMMPKTPKQEPPKPVSGSIELENEHIAVSGALESSGEPKKKYDKFTTRENININIPVNKGGTLTGLINIKTMNYEDKNAQLEKILFTYKKGKLLVSAGDVFPNISKIVFNKSLEGLYTEYKFKEGGKDGLRAFAGREGTAYEGIYFARYDAGLSLTKIFQKKHQIDFNFAYIADDENSIGFDSDIIPVKNILTGVFGKMKYTKEFSIDWEMVYSLYNENTRVSSEYYKDLAADVKAAYIKNKRNFTLSYYSAGPDFVTINGIATSDREKYTLSFSDEYFKKLTVTSVMLFQHDNLTKWNIKTGYLKENSLSLNYSPFKQSKNENLKNISAVNGLSLKRNYNRFIDTLTPADKELKTTTNNFKISNSMFKGKYSCYAAFDYDYEDDIFNLTKTFTKNYEVFNGLKYKIIKIISFDFNNKLRYKTSNDKTDRYINGNISLAYQKNKIVAGIDYYYDINYTSVEGQDSKKHKLGGNFEYTVKKKKLTNKFNIKLTYDINSYEDETQDYKKLNLLTSLKILF